MEICYQKSYVEEEKLSDNNFISIWRGQDYTFISFSSTQMALFSSGLNFIIIVSTSRQSPQIWLSNLSSCMQKVSRSLKAIGMNVHGYWIIWIPCKITAMTLICWGNEKSQISRLAVVLNCFFCTFASHMGHFITLAKAAQRKSQYHVFAQ